MLRPVNFLLGVPYTGQPRLASQRPGTEAPVQCGTPADRPSVMLARRSILFVRGVKSSGEVGGSAVAIFGPGAGRAGRPEACPGRARHATLGGGRPARKVGGRSGSGLSEEPVFGV